jgi:hypothetical protein
MCLIIHKPAGEFIPEDLLRAGASLNHDGWGLMGFGTDGKPLIERRSQLDIEELLAIERRLRGAEYALHLRRRTRGDVSESNAHPFRITDDIYLMHNGRWTWRPARRDAPTPGTWCIITCDRLSSAGPDCCVTRHCMHCCRSACVRRTASCCCWRAQNGS